MSRSLALVITLSLLAACHSSTPVTVPDGARICHGIPIPERAQVGGRDVSLNGVAVRDVTIFDVDVYVGALYLEQPSPDASTVVDSEQPKRVLLRFLREVTRTDITTAFRTGFVNNAGTERLGLETEIEQFLGYFSDLEEHAEMQFDYVPGTGMTVSVNGELRGTIANPAFQRAFFLVFVGPQPPSEALKRGLLGGPCE